MKTGKGALEIQWSGPGTGDCRSPPGGPPLCACGTPNPAKDPRRFLESFTVGVLNASVAALPWPEGKQNEEFLAGLDQPQALGVKAHPKAPASF